MSQAGGSGSATGPSSMMYWGIVKEPAAGGIRASTATTGTFGAARAIAPAGTAVPTAPASAKVTGGSAWEQQLQDLEKRMDDRFDALWCADRKLEARIDSQLADALEQVAELRQLVSSLARVISDSQFEQPQKRDFESQPVQAAQQPVQAAPQPVQATPREVLEGVHWDHDIEEHSFPQDPDSPVLKKSSSFSSVHAAHFDYAAVRVELDQFKKKFEDFMEDVHGNLKTVHSKFLDEPWNRVDVNVASPSFEGDGEAEQGISHKRSAEADGIKTRELAEAEVEKGFYPFSESLYDCGALLFSRLVFMEDSCFVLVGVLFCLATQVAIMILLGSLIVYSGTDYDSPLSDEMQRNAERWRHQQAHFLENMNPLQNTSLARAACALDTSLPISDFQMRLIFQVRDYTNPIADIVPRGLCMTMIVLSLWICFMAKELDSCISMGLAILSMNKGWGGHLVIDEISEGQRDLRFQITYMDHRRAIFVSFLCIVRFTVAVGLTAIGCRWLVETTQITELVLNTISLQFIVEADEIIYVLLASQEFKWLIHHMEPLGGDFIPRNRVNHLLIPTLTVVFGVATWCYFIFRYAVPHIDIMNDLEETFCGGWQDFVYMPDNKGMLHVARTSPDESSRLWAKPVVLDLIDTKSSAGATFWGGVADLWNLYDIDTGQ